MFLRARYYDPRTGRFLTEDPAAGYMAIPRSLHIYVYAWNNPVNLHDASGRQVHPPVYCPPGNICYTGTTGGQVTSSAWAIPNLGPSSNEGKWVIYKYERRSSISIYEESSVGVEASRYAGWGGGASLEQVVGRQYTGANPWHLWQNMQAGNAEYYETYNLQIQLGYGATVNNTIGANGNGYIELSANDGAFDPNNLNPLSPELDNFQNFNVVMGAQAEIGPIGVAFEGNAEVTSLEFSFAHSVGPQDLGWQGPVDFGAFNQCTVGFSYNNTDEIWVLVPKRIVAEYPNPDALAYERFPVLVGALTGNTLDRYWYAGRDPGMRIYEPLTGDNPAGFVKSIYAFGNDYIHNSQWTMPKFESPFHWWEAYADERPMWAFYYE